MVYLYSWQVAAFSGLLDYLMGTLNKHRVFASVDPRNVPWIALFKRIGMREEARFRESLWFKGEWVDGMMFGILNSEWKTRQGCEWQQVYQR